MPPKKKKPPFNLDEVDDDIFSYVELVQDCLERADKSQKACLEGIIKSDLALRQSQSDADIHFIVLVRRAELLLIAARMKYDTSDLPAAHRNPLKSCINDCERVIAKVSAADPISKGIYEQACTILKGAKDIQKTHSTKHVESKGGASGTFQRYDPTKTLFRNVTKINPYLLQDIVNCYQHAKIVCRTCYYKLKQQEPLGANRHCRRCKKTTHPLVIIPASQMCDNLIGARTVAVPAPPKSLMTRENKHKSFQMCKKNEHKLCFDKSASGDTWFAHSIEELVVWTIERHYDVKFSRYIEVYHRDHDPPDHSLFDGRQSSDNTYFNSNSSSTAVSLGVGQGQEKKVYDYYASECIFRSVAAIPDRLFWDVLNCYKNFKEYCKWCYYVKDQRGVVVINRRSNSTMCSNCQKPWESVIVIPASSLCWNFGNFDELPIAPWPRDKPTREPFEYCKKKDHYRCFRVYVDSSFWYPHSVEELVIWTVEREKKCTFHQFMQKAIQLPSPTPSPRQTPPPPAMTSSTASVPIPVSNSPQQRQQSPQQNLSVITNSSASYATVSMSPKKKKGPPSPLSLGGQSPPPPSFSSVAAGHSPKPTSPLLRLQQQAPPTKAQAALPPSSSSVQPVDRTMMLTGVHMQSGRMEEKNLISKTGRLADITGPAESFVQVGFPFLITQNETISNDVSVTAVSSLPTQHPHLAQMFTTANDVVQQSSIRLNPGKGVVGGAAGGGAGIDTLAGSSFPVVASVSSRRNYRVASTSADVPGPSNSSTAAAAGGSFGQFKKEINSDIHVIFGDGIGSREGGATSSASNRILDTTETVTLKAIYKFSEVNFKLFSDIPPSLLREIALCFKDKKLVCRRCFYGDRSISHLVQPKNICSSGEHMWSNPVLVIPGCGLCDNEPLFKHGEHVAVPPLPPVAIIKKCEKFNHHKCFAQSLEVDQRFAHSVEELIVWMVESENECSFEQFASANGLLQAQLTNVTTKSSNDALQVNSNQKVPQATFVPQQSKPHPPPSVPTPVPAATVTMETTSASGSGTNVDQSFSSVRAAASYMTNVMGEKLYDPKKIEFVNIKDIPKDLLNAVAECFNNRLFVCRICFFESQCTSLISKIETKQAIMCELGHTPWKQIKVIPRCKLCITPGNHAPIPPLPKHMKNSNIPFAVCKKTEHQTCYAMSRGTNPWFPHTVEELVIWTVERETGIDFEECYKEYLPSYAKTKNSMDAVSQMHTFYQPTSTLQSPMATTPIEQPHLPLSVGLQGVRVTSNGIGAGPQPLQSLYSKPLTPQNGFKNALGLANLPQASVENRTEHFQYAVAPSLTQPEPYHSGNSLPGEFRFGGGASTQFDFPKSSRPPTRPTTTSGPIAGYVPPLANNMAASPANPSVPSGDPSATAGVFTNFFPALLSDNPLSNDTQDVSMPPSEKSVTDLFNLTAGLDLNSDFENPLALGSSLGSQERRGGIGAAVMSKHAADIESSWNKQSNKVNVLASGRHSITSNGSSFQTNEEGSLFINSSKDPSEISDAAADSSHVDQSHLGFGRMDSFGFNPSGNNSTVHRFDADSSVHNSTLAGGDATSRITGNPNWPNFVRVPNLPSSQLASGDLSADTSDNNTVDNSEELKLPRMPNTEPYVLGKSVNNQKNATNNNNNNRKRGARGKKKKGKSNENSVSQSRKGIVDNSSSNVSAQQRQLGDFSTSRDPPLEAEVQRELNSIGIGKQRPTSGMNYDLSSSSSPNLVGMNPVPGFRSEGHTPPPPTTSEVTAAEVVVSSAKTAPEPFSDFANHPGEDAVLYLESDDVNAATSTSELEHHRLLTNGGGIDDMFSGHFDEPPTFSSMETKVEGRSSLLGSIMAARASKASEHNTVVQSGNSDGDIPAYESTEKIPFFETIKDIEDEISEESTEKGITEVTSESASATVEGDVSTAVPSDGKVVEAVEMMVKQESHVEVEPSVPDTTITTSTSEPAQPVNPAPQKEDTEPSIVEESTFEGGNTKTPSASNEVERLNMTKLEGVVRDEPVGETVPDATLAATVTESSVDPDPQITSKDISKQFLEWDLSASSDEYDPNIEGEDQTLQHVPIEDWGCTLSDDDT